MVQNQKQMADQALKRGSIAEVVFIHAHSTGTDKTKLLKDVVKTAEKLTKHGKHLTLILVQE